VIFTIPDSQPTLTLNSKGPSDVSICVKKEAPLQSVMSQVCVRDFVGGRPTCEDGSEVGLMLGTDRIWHKISLCAPSGEDTTSLPLSASGGLWACGIVTEHKIETAIACHHCERISWDPVIEWDHKLALGPICPHTDNGSSGGSGRDGDDLHGDGDHDGSGCQRKTSIDGEDTEDNDFGADGRLPDLPRRGHDESGQDYDASHALESSRSQALGKRKRTFSQSLFSADGQAGAREEDARSKYGAFKYRRVN
jgi:hypothetical protein